MLRTISAAPSPVERSGPAVVRSGPSRTDRNSKDDNDNDFSHALRGARDDKSDSDSDRDRSAQSTRPSTSATRQERKEEAPKKRTSKDADDNEQSSKTAVIESAPAQPKEALPPLAALLNFVSYRASAPTEEPKPQDSGISVAAAAAPDNPLPAAPEPALSDTISAVDIKPADVKSGDVKAAAATNGRTQSRVQSMSVPSTTIQFCKPASAGVAQRLQ